MNSIVTYVVSNYLRTIIHARLWSYKIYPKLDGNILVGCYAIKTYMIHMRSTFDDDDILIPYLIECILTIMYGDISYNDIHSVEDDDYNKKIPNIHIYLELLYDHLSDKNITDIIKLASINSDYKTIVALKKKNKNIKFKSFKLCSYRIPKCIKIRKGIMILRLINQITKSPYYTDFFVIHHFSSLKYYLNILELITDFKTRIDVIKVMVNRALNFESLKTPLLCKKLDEYPVFFKQFCLTNYPKCKEFIDKL